MHMYMIVVYMFFFCFYAVTEESSCYKLRLRERLQSDRKLIGSTLFSVSEYHGLCLLKGKQVQKFFYTYLNFTKPFCYLNVDIIRDLNFGSLVYPTG